MNKWQTSDQKQLFTIFVWNQQEYISYEILIDYLKNDSFELFVHRILELKVMKNVILNIIGHRRSDVVSIR